MLCELTTGAAVAELISLIAALYAETKLLMEPTSDELSGETLMFVVPSPVSVRLMPAIAFVTELEPA